MGNKVFVKRFRKDNKLSTEFSPEEHIVIRRTGADVELRSMESGKECRRNVVHLKKIPVQNSSAMDTSASESRTSDVVNGETHITGPDQEQHSTVEEFRQRSKRDRKEPAKYQDYLPY